MKLAKQLLVAVSAAGMTTVAATAQQHSVGLELFEDSVPPRFQAQGGKVSISSAHSKNGASSLEWRWEQGGTLTVAGPFGYRHFVANKSSQGRPGVSLWLYSPAAREGVYRFDFYRGKERVTGFTVNAQFSGWRAATLAFDGDMDGRAVEDMDRLVITPPAGGGSLFIDELAFGMPIDPRHPSGDYQLPGLNPNAIEKTNAHWTALLTYDRWLQESEAKPVPAGPEMAPVPAADISAIHKRISGELLEAKALALPEIENRYAKLHNSVGVLKPLSQTSQQWAMYQKGAVAPETMATLRASTVTWRDFGQFMKIVAVAWNKAAPGTERDRLREIFSALVRHQIDQGLVRGSGQGIMHHQGYQLGDWAQALFLMRDAMGPERESARQAMAWYAGQGRLFEPTTDESDFNADVMNTLLQPMLFAILMDSDGKRRDRMLRTYGSWISDRALRSPGLTGGFKADGSVFHHMQHYVAYGNGALDGVSGVAWFLSGTELQLTPSAHQRIRHAILVSRLFSNGGLIPMSLTGRHADGIQKIALDPFRHFALIGAPGAVGAGPDREVGAAYLRLLDRKGPGIKLSSADREAARLLRQAGITPEPDPVGSWVMPYSSMVLHRRDGWLWAARGFSRYLVSHESYPRENMFGRYMNYGALEFLPADMSGRGFSMAGWDWNRWPGTTAVRLPLDKLRAGASQIDKSSGTEEMLLSEQTYSGGVEWRGQAALFAMKLQGHPKYSDDLVARKSVFFFGNRAIAIGSGITANVPGAPVQTTVFQDKVKAAQGSAALEGAAVAVLVPEMRMRLASWRSAIDEHGNGVCLAPGQNILFARTDQNSIDEDGITPTRGRFSTLVIDHGASPKQAGYEYAYLVGSGLDGTRKFCAAMKSARGAPYKVLSRDARAHVVADGATGLVGYALFEAGTVSAPGVLTSVSAPAMVMLRSGKGRIEGAFTNPDLNLYQGRDPEQYDSAGKWRERSVYGLGWNSRPSAPLTTSLVFKGRWRLADASTHLRARIEGNVTVVEIETVGGAPMQFELVQG